MFLICVFLTVVAPLVGAWIETGYKVKKDIINGSHPSWVRGLKLGMQRGVSSDKKSHPSWVRGLKLLKSALSFSSSCRTPRGCVD